VILKKDGRFIGQCGISMQDIDGVWVPEIGYHIHKSYWGRGKASEAALGLLEYGFSKAGLREIFVHTSVKNIPSIRVAEKIGMIKRKEYYKVLEKSKETMRHVVYSIKRNDWSK